MMLWKDLRYASPVLLKNPLPDPREAREFRRQPWLDQLEPGTVTPLSISVKTPATTHEVSIKQLERWIASTPKSPREIAQRSRVQELLQQKG